MVKANNGCKILANEGWTYELYLGSATECISCWHCNHLLLYYFRGLCSCCWCMAQFLVIVQHVTRQQSLQHPQDEIQSCSELDHQVHVVSNFSHRQSVGSLLHLHTELLFCHGSLVVSPSVMWAVYWRNLMQRYPSWHTVCGKKVSPIVVCHFLSNHLEFLREILYIYYLFIYT